MLDAGCGENVTAWCHRSPADQANRLNSATVSGVTSEFTYDGKRLSKTVGSSVYSYFYDVNRSLPVALEDEFRRNVWGNDLAYAVDIHLLSFAPSRQGAASPEAPSSYPGQILVYHKDGLGSVRAITDTAGDVIETYETDEFGVVTGASGSVDQPFGYTGEIRDTETGLVYLRSRYYVPPLAAS